MTVEDLRASQSGCENQGSGAGADPNLPGGHRCGVDQSTTAAGDLSTRNGHMSCENHASPAVAGLSSTLAPAWSHTPQPTNEQAAPTSASSAGDPNSRQATHGPEPIFMAPAGSHSSPTAMANAQATDGPPSGTPSCGDHASSDTHDRRVAAPTPPGAASEPPAAIPTAPCLADPLLALAADVLDDLERVRIANENRLRQLTRDETDKDGEERGFGLTLDHPDVARLAALVEALARAEHDATLNLKRMVRLHPLGPWIKAAKGVGEKQGARLLAAIGDPYWNDLHDRPRMVSELWTYCGYHVVPAGHRIIDTQPADASGVPSSARHMDDAHHEGSADGTQPPTSQSGCENQESAAGGDPAGSSPGHPSFGPSVGAAAAHAGGDPGHELCGTQNGAAGVAATLTRGQRANWNATAKMRARLVAESCIKVADSPYRAVYDAGRTKYADALHATECKRCGPAGNPAPAGSPLSAGHQHARALRLVSKAVLKDLWCAAKRIHEGQVTP